MQIDLDGAAVALDGDTQSDRRGCLGGACSPMADAARAGAGR